MQIDGPPMTQHLTAQDFENFGGEFVDLAQRAAMHTVAPQLQEVGRQNAKFA
jgi:hypothetical protein